MKFPKNVGKILKFPKNVGIFLNFAKNCRDIFECFSDEFSLFSHFPDIVNEAGELAEKITAAKDQSVKAKLYTRLQLILIKLQDINDEKIALGQMLSEMIETKSKSVDRDYQNNVNSKSERIQSPVPTSSTARNASIVQQVLSSLPLKNSSAPGSNMSSSTNNSENNGSGQDKNVKRARRARVDTIADVVVPLEVPIKTEPIITKPTPPVNQSTGINVKKASTSSGGSGKKQKKAARKTNLKQNAAAVQEQVPGVIQDETIDPDEETYCLCGQISYGEMILCENDLCPIEWFHFSCVSLQSKPKGRWFCPNCRGDRQNVMNKNLRKKEKISIDN